MGLAPAGFCAFMTQAPGSSGENYSYDTVLAYCSELASPRVGNHGGRCQLLKLFVLRILPVCPCSALAANLLFLVEWKLAFGVSAQYQDWVSPQVCTRAAFPFLSASAIWAFVLVGSDLFDVEII